MTGQAAGRHRFLKWTGIVLLALIALAVAFVSIYGAAVMQSTLQGEGSARLGRDLVIEGPVDIDWHWLFRCAKASRSPPA